jgi:hypothetical protein
MGLDGDEFLANYEELADGLYEVQDKIEEKISSIQIELMKVQEEYDNGTISVEEYRKETDRLNGSLARYQVLQSESTDVLELNTKKQENLLSRRLDVNAVE